MSRHSSTDRANTAANSTIEVEELHLEEITLSAMEDDDHLYEEYGEFDDYAGEAMSAKMRRSRPRASDWK